MNFALCISVTKNSAFIGVIHACKLPVLLLLSTLLNQSTQLCVLKSLVASRRYHYMRLGVTTLQAILVAFLYTILF